MINIITGDPRSKVNCREVFITDYIKNNYIGTYLDATRFLSEPVDAKDIERKFYAPIIRSLDDPIVTDLIIEYPEMGLSQRSQVKLAQSLITKIFNTPNYNLTLLTQSDIIFNEIRYVVKENIISHDEISIKYFSPIKVFDIKLDKNAKITNLQEGFLGWVYTDQMCKLF